VLDLESDGIQCRCVFARFWNFFVDLGSGDVAAVGRIREKTRWKLGAEKARQHAIQAAGFAMNADGKLARDPEGHAIRVPREILDSEFAERWEVAPDFQEVPSHLLADNLWKKRNV